MSLFDRFTLSSRAFLKSALVVVALAGLVSGLTGCNRLFSSGVARDDLSLVPGDTAAVFLVNLKQARGSRLWQKLIEARDKEPASRKDYQDFVQKCGLDPLNDLESIFLAVPANAQQSRDYALLIRGRYKADGILNCARSSAKERGEVLSESDYNNIHIVSSSSQTQGPQLAVLGSRAIVVASPGWMKRVIDFHSGKESAASSARENKTLRTMLGRTNTSGAFWFAGEVPPAMADRLRAWPQLGSAGSLHSVSGSIEVKQGLSVHSDLDLGSDADATSVSTSVASMLSNLRQDSRLQMMGMAGYLDTLKVGANKSTFVIDLKMTDQQLDDLTTRLAGLSKSLTMGM